MQGSEDRVVVRVVPLAREPDVIGLRDSLDEGFRASGAVAVVEVQSVENLEHNAAGKVSLIKAMAPR